jgi:hypothetical protein
MASVTVPSGTANTVLHYDTALNAATARQMTDQLRQEIASGRNFVAKDSDGPPTAVPTGQSGEWLQTQDGFTALPSGYQTVVDTAPNAVIEGSGDKGQMVFSDQNSNLTFFDASGSGTIAGGGGDSFVAVGNWETRVAVSQHRIKML